MSGGTTETHRHRILLDIEVWTPELSRRQINMELSDGIETSPDWSLYTYIRQQIH
jgi:hypothetical protein